MAGICEGKTPNVTNYSITNLDFVYYIREKHHHIGYK